MLPKFLMWSTIAQLQNAVAVLLIRISVCLFILRVVGVTHRGTAYFIISLIVFMTCFAFATLLTVGLQCIPLKRAWYPTTPGHCIHEEVLTKLTNAYGGNPYIPSAYIIVLTRLQQLVVSWILRVLPFQSGSFEVYK